MRGERTPQIISSPSGIAPPMINRYPRAELLIGEKNVLSYLCTMAYGMANRSGCSHSEQAEHVQVFAFVVYVCAFLDRWAVIMTWRGPDNMFSNTQCIGFSPGKRKKKDTSGKIAPGTCN